MSLPAAMAASSAEWVIPARRSFLSRPIKRHTHDSLVNLTQLPSSVQGSRVQGSKVGIDRCADQGCRRVICWPPAIPKVTIVKHARYLPEDTSGDASSEVDILARIENNLRAAPLAGFVAEGSAPFGAMSNSVDAALKARDL